jgi:hypothetical protein
LSPEMRQLIGFISARRHALYDAEDRDSLD